MADQPTRTELNHVREMREERRADFWQRQINDGRMQRHADDQMKAGETPEQKPRVHRHIRNSRTYDYDASRCMAKGRPSREVREERRRAFWQAQINEGRAMAAEQQARTNKPAAPRHDPPPSPPPPARVPLHVVSAHTEFTDTTPINPADIPALFLAATSVLRLINAGTSDGRRFSAAPQAKDRGGLEARTDRSPEFDR